MTELSKSSAIEKVVRVLEALAGADRLSEIARQTGLPVSTVHRILQELGAVGWVREAGEHRYVLGSRLMSLPVRSTGSTDLVRLARPTLRELSAQTGRTIHFAMVEGDQLVYIDKLEGIRPYAMKSRVGTSLPLHCTAIGKAVLALLDEEEVRGIAKRTALPRQTARTLTDVKSLIRHLRTVRSRRFAVDDEENETHIRCIGAAVADYRGLPVGGLSVSSLAYDLSGTQALEIGPLVIAAADRISAIMGDPRPRTGPADPRLPATTRPGSSHTPSAAPAGAGASTWPPSPAATMPLGANHDPPTYGTFASARYSDTSGWPSARRASI